MLLLFALGRKEESIDGFDKQHLAMLGFSLRSAKDQLVVADVAGKAGKDRSFSTDDKVAFIHCCCKKGNLLSKPIEGKGVKITDITKEDDFTSANTVKYVIRQIKRSGRHFL